jgi:hypothetical protein
MHQNPSTSDDAASNRAGQLSARQRQKLARDVRNLGCASVGVAVFAVFFLWQVASGLALFQRIHLWALLPAGFWGVFALIAVGLVALFALMLVDTWLDLSQGRVEQGRGVAVWRRGAYAVQMQGWWLGVDKGPGAYQFYYLPHTHKVLSTQRLGLESASQFEHDLLAALAQANRFNIEALPNYRAGRLGDERWSILTRALRFNCLIFLFSLVCVALMAWLELSRPGDLCGVEILAPGALLFVFLASWSSLAVTRDVLAGTVASQVGQVQRVHEYGPKTDRYKYRLGKLTFGVTIPAYNALVDGRQYRVYYLPRSGQLVAIEPLN